MIGSEDSVASIGPNCYIKTSRNGNKSPGHIKWCNKYSARLESRFMCYVLIHLSSTPFSLHEITKCRLGGLAWLVRLLLRYIYRLSL